MDESTIQLEQYLLYLSFYLLCQHQMYVSHISNNHQNILFLTPTKIPMLLFHAHSEHYFHNISMSTIRLPPILHLNGWSNVKFLLD